MNPRLILASASPRRKALLETMGLAFSIHPADIDESYHGNESPIEYVQRLSIGKADAVQQQLNDNVGKQSEELVVLAADTIVCQQQDIFGKPKDKADAFRIWQKLSDSTHQVMTAVSIQTSGSINTQVCVTDVEFCSISEQQMQRYWASGEPLDKAGGYAIQGYASAWVNLIHGSYSNVVGLPLKEVNEMLSVVNLNWL